ncbi:Transposase IS4 [Popillia japonica]|uniref:Transposase IS4 n=1 Tax=Popillia japonica TaxID=7064 RepID=A0AAW1J199_POPJA
MLKQKKRDEHNAIIDKDDGIIVVKWVDNNDEHNAIIDKDDGIIVVKWVDNNVVTAASTCHGIHPIATVKRFSRTEKKIIHVSRPSIIMNYNQFMGGTDILDENVSNYRISVRRQKWWWPIFTWLLDVSVVSAWIVYRQFAPTYISA